MAALRVQTKLAPHAGSRQGLTALRQWLRVTVVGLVAVILTACGGSDGGDAVPSASAEIGPAGGTLSGPDGVQVVVPAGALAQPTLLSVTRSSVGAPTVMPEDNQAGPIYEFLPHGLVFNKPVTIRMPVPAGATGEVAFMASPGEGWQVSDANVSGGVAEWQRNSFSWGMLPLVCAPSNSAPYSASNPDPYPCSGPRGAVSASAIPSTAITQQAYGNPFGNAGSWVVNEAGTVRLTINYQAAPDCMTTGAASPSGRIKLLQWDPTVPLGTPNRVTTLEDRIVALTAQPVTIPAGVMATATGTYTRAVGSAYFDVPFSDTVNTGTKAFGYSFSCNRPSRPTQSGGDLVTFVSAIPAPAASYTVGGTVSGLTGTGLTLQNNGANNLPVSANGVFTFSAPVASGSAYAVTVQTQPSGQVCSVANGSGTAGSNVSNVAVTCVSGTAWQGATLIETGNGDLPVAPMMAMDPNGNAFAIWVQNGVGFFAGIMTNRFVAGTGWEAATLMEASDTNVSVPGIAMQDNGNAIAVWPQHDGTRISIWASRFVVGTGWSTPQLIETDNAGDAERPRVAIDAGGNAIAVWYQYSGNQASIWSNRYVSGTGWGTATLLETGLGTAFSPTIAINASGNAIAGWMQFDVADARYNAMVNRYVVGSGWGTATVIETDNVSDAGSPDIALDASGNAIAVWFQSSNIWTNRYVVGSGWSTAELLGNVSAGEANPAPLVMDANGNAMVVWSQSDGTRFNVWARRYVAGTGWGTATLIETDNAGDAGTPSIAMNANGDAVAAWHQSDGTRTNVWANRYLAGTGWGSPSLIEIDNTGDAQYPRVGMSSNGNAIATWFQWDGTRNNVWANQINGNANQVNNNAPVANAGPDQIVNMAATATLDGTASTDPESNTLTYKWIAPFGITLSSTTAAKPTITAPTVSINTSYTITLTVNDGLVDSTVDQVVITVKNTNAAPVANAGSDQIVNIGTTVSLDGSTSADPEGNSLTYRWTAPAGITLSSTTDARPTFTAPSVIVNTSYTLSLVVNDGLFNSTIDQVVVIIKTSNTAPVANAGPDQIVNMAATVSLDGTASTDPDRNPLTYRWAAPAGIILSSTTAANPTFTAPTVIVNTSYTLSLVVNDGLFNSTADQVVITIKTSNTAPVASAGVDQVISEGTATTLDGSASTDPDRNPLTYRWTAPTGIILSSTTAAKPIFTAPAVNINTSYTLTLVVNDGLVNSSTDQVVITVRNINNAPVANAGVDQTVNEGATTALDGSASADPDTNPLTYRWTAPAGIILSSTTDPRPTFTAPPVVINTSYTFSLTVNDGVLESPVDQVVITVRNVN